MHNKPNQAIEYINSYKTRPQENYERQHLIKEKTRATGTS